MAFQFKNNFNEGINLDLDELRMPPNAALFIKNLTTNVNTNQSAPGFAGQNSKVLTPLEGNVALTISGMPSGTNYCIGFYSSEQTNEGYFACWNSNNDHTIWVISGDNGQVRKVRQDALLPFVLDPAYFLAEGRMTMELISTIDPVTEAETNFKLLVFSNNSGYQGMIDVEASIATDSYSTAYFTDTSSFYEPVELINLGSALPIRQINLNDPNPYVPTTEDANRQNLLINAGWQFRIRTWDVWGRPSEWGIISNVFTVLTGGGCISTSNGLSRCVNLCFDAGSPIIKFITVAYRRGVGNDPSGQTETEWYETETFRKYDDSTGVEWYERPYNPAFVNPNSGISFDLGTNTLTYTFCADKGSNPIDPSEAARTEPGIPRWSGSAFSVNKTVGLANNVYGFRPVAQEIINQIDFSVKVPDAGQVPCPAAPLRTMTFYAHIYNAFQDSHPYIRKTFDIYTFGDGGNTIGPSDTSCYVSNFKVAQVFGDQANPGFIAYLAGTPFKVIGVWGDYNPATDVFTPQPIDTIGSFPNIKMIQFKFVDIPAGKYIVRLASHHATINDGNLQKTSTQVVGCCPIENAQIAWGCRVGYFSNPIKELVGDCSTGNVNNGGKSNWMFVILDGNDGVKSNAIDGYLYEQAGAAPVEMAPCYIHGSTLGQAGDAYGTFFTDHNGYYYACSGSQYAGIDILSSLCDGGPMYGVFSQTAGCGGSTGKMAHGDGSGMRNPDYWGNFGNWANQVYIARPGGVVTSYPQSARRTIRQTFTVCGQPSVGVPGIPVVMTKCQSQMTDSSGLAIITAHNRYNYLTAIGGSTPPFGSNVIPDYGSAPGNRDLLIFSQKGGCEWNACGGCNTYISDSVVNYLDCGAPATGCSTSQPDRTTCMDDQSVTPNGVGISGLPSGAKLPVAFWLHDVLGRHTAPQIKTGELGYVYTPNLNDGATGGATSPFSPPYPAMALCSLQLVIPPGLNVGSEFKFLTPLVGDNVIYGDSFSWSADWVQYVDNTGVTNTTNPTAIRIYFQSLNEYNKQYNESTNVGWDFVVQSEGQVLPSDIVQFIMNGDGTFLPSIKGAPITYDKFGAFFTIDYQPELAGLQNGCLFKVIRPKQNTTGVNLPYYEQDLVIPIVNGEIVAGTYDIPFKQAYLLSRSIPVPLMKGQPGPIPPGGTPPNPIQYTSSNQNPALATDGYSQNNTNNNNGVVIFQTVDAQTTFPFFFESPSPSDLWGSHLVDHGRVGIPNPYEKQYRVGTEIAVSNPIADKGIVNGMGVFLESNRHVFDRNTFGDITSVLVEMGVCMVICNNDFFITRYNQTQIQIADNGQLLGQNPAGSLFTAPQTKVGANYGVIPVNINTIEKYDGMVKFLDNKGHVIFSDFSSAKPVERDGYLGYILQKISFTNIRNLTPNTNGLTYWHGRTDPKNMEYVLSNFNIPHIGAPSYINTQSQPNLASNETYIFDLLPDPETGKIGKLKTFASYTPEMFGKLPGFWLQRQFLSFKNGIPYIHHNNYANNVAPPLYCNFYGTQCEVRITHVINGIDGKVLPDKVKRFFWSEIYCRANMPSSPPGSLPVALFFADVINSEKGQTSRLLIARWDLRDGYQTAAYICASNTPTDHNIPIATGVHAILDGDALQGRWLKVSITNNPAWPGTYFEISEKVDYINGVEKSAN